MDRPTQIIRLDYTSLRYRGRHLPDQQVCPYVCGESRIADVPAHDEFFKPKPLLRQRKPPMIYPACAELTQAESGRVVNAYLWQPSCCKTFQPEARLVWLYRPTGMRVDILAL